MTLPTAPMPEHLERARASWRNADALALSADAARSLLVGELAYSLPGADGGAADEGYKVVDGVAVVRVRGALSNCEWSWWDSYEAIAKRAAHAQANGAVRAVMFDFDSPGGTVAGLFDGMRALRAARAAGGKRTVAWVGGAAYSAAYGLASTCDEVVVEELAGVGSIGVIDTMRSYLGEAKKEGIDVRVIASGTEKTDGHPFVAISDEAEARRRERVMAMASAFVREIALSRPALTPEAALALDGGLRFGAAAVAEKLADRVSTRAALLAELAATKTSSNPSNPSGPRGSASAQTPTRKTTMNEQQLAALNALLAAKTGETDPDRQLGALSATFDLAARGQTAEAELRVLKEKIAKDAKDAEAKARVDAFHAAVKVGEDAGKLTPAEAEQWRADFAKGECTIGVLEGNLARRSVIPALAPEHKELRAPAAPATVPGASARVSALVQKGYAALTWDERNELAIAAPELADRLMGEWIASGRPSA
ncbi:MAG: S49 family peptidase [Deltaproteobacteria bacterium]|nr:S49 family peptidase [Myxococcales bacterium]MDP3217686.1 S49 family peptidase [Deltaproteobacteria bacterium]